MTGVRDEMAAGIVEPEDVIVAWMGDDTGVAFANK
jgi:hypothetical protein